MDILENQPFSLPWNLEILKSVQIGFLSINRITPHLLGWADQAGGSDGSPWGPFELHFNSYEYSKFNLMAWGTGRARILGISPDGCPIVVQKDC